MARLGPRDSLHDDRLIRYVLGALPDEEAEQLDEQSVVDDELAERLRLIEDDLVDAYASGQLTGDTLRRFESFYLASPRRRNKAAFAKRLLAAIDSPNEPLAPLGPPSDTGVSLRGTHAKSRWSWL